MSIVTPIPEKVSLNIKENEENYPLWRRHPARAGDPKSSVSIDAELISRRSGDRQQGRNDRGRLDLEIKPAEDGYRPGKQRNPKAAIAVNAPEATSSGDSETGVRGRTENGRDYAAGDDFAPGDLGGDGDRNGATGLGFGLYTPVRFIDNCNPGPSSLENCSSCPSNFESGCFSPDCSGSFNSNPAGFKVIKKIPKKDKTWIFERYDDMRSCGHH